MIFFSKLLAMGKLKNQFRIPSMVKVILLFSIFSIGCANKYIQVFETKSNSCKLKDDTFFFENDSIKITYSLWANQGVMSFGIFNKMNIPIYIDWKKSSFIYNGIKLNYWIDEANMDLKAYYGGYFYNGPLIKPGYNIGETIGLASSKISKPERITFIPPQSSYYRSQFHLLPIAFYDLPLTTEFEVLPRNDMPEKSTHVWHVDFSSENSPLSFRNYIAVSVFENGESPLFIDNSFYISSILEMNYKHFQGKEIGVDKDYNVIYEKPYSKNTSFYIKIDPINSIEYREQYSK
jgi:hypothetical protein